MDWEQHSAPREFAAPAGKAPVPGLTLVFFIGLCAGGAFLGLSAFFFLTQLVGDKFWSSEAKAAFIGLAAWGVMGALLCWWAGNAIYERKPGAPARCRILLALNMAVAVLGIAGIILFIGLHLGEGLETTFDFLGRNNLPGLLAGLLVVIIICEAWRRYFLFSPKVRQAFGLYQPPEYAAELPPAEIALFTVVCWLCPAHYGLPHLFSERLFIPLAFWWYFAVSAKARAWFSATDLPWAEKAAQL